LIVEFYFFPFSLSPNSLSSHFLPGLGAVIIAPTRELGVQIFDVLKKVGKFHSFSAGLVIGGKDKETEAKYINSMNILVATPG